MRFPYPYSLVQKWVPMGVAYDIIFSIIAGLPDCLLYTSDAADE